MDRQGREFRFVEHLWVLKARNDRGALAALRAGLGKEPGTVLAMAPSVEGWVSGLKDWDRGRFYLVASLFALYAGDSRRSSRTNDLPRNLGAVLAGVARAHTRNGTSLAEARRRIERRFATLLGAHVDDLYRHLRHAAYLAKSENVPIDYVTLLRDLRYWDHEKQWVQRRWAAGFWAANREDVDVCGVASDSEFRAVVPEQR